tara:strand:- start:26467 stop:27210 length:744 start_codon:yes stop_codon:yes gene_type:complete
MSRRTLIVGDQFSEFCTEDSTITLCQFQNRVDSNDVDGQEFIVGQGIKHDEVARLSEPVDNQGHSIIPRQPLAQMALTHKHEEKNVLISEPVKQHARLFTLEMMLNDESDRLVDHVTGKHIGGMVLVEAARQASIACSEIALEIDTKEVKQGFIWKSMNVEFKRFVFPAPTDIKVEIIIHEDSTDDKTVMSTVVTFIQNAKELCTITNDFDVTASSFISKVESRSAEKLILDMTSSIDESADKKCAA